jgi:hypothetical protein
MVHRYFQLNNQMQCTRMKRLPMERHQLDARQFRIAASQSGHFYDSSFFSDVVSGLVTSSVAFSLLHNPHAGCRKLWSRSK